MTLALTLLARAAEDTDDARYILPRLALTRRPRSRQDAEELALWRALEPLLAVHAGNVLELWRACPQRWRDSLTLALSLPAWWHERCEPLPALVLQWEERGGEGWQLPDRVVTVTAASSADRPTAQPLTLALRRAPLETQALGLWQKRERLRGSAAPFLDPLHRAAILEAQARDAERHGLHCHTAGWLEKLRTLREDEAAKRRRADRAALRRDALQDGRARNDAA